MKGYLISQFLILGGVVVLLHREQETHLRVSVDFASFPPCWVVGVTILLIFDVLVREC